MEEDSNLLHLRMVRERRASGRANDCEYCAIHPERCPYCNPTAGEIAYLEAYEQRTKEQAGWTPAQRNEYVQARKDDRERQEREARELARETRRQKDEDWFVAHSQRPGPNDPWCEHVPREICLHHEPIMLEGFWPRHECHLPALEPGCIPRWFDGSLIGPAAWAELNRRVSAFFNEVQAGGFYIKSPPKPEPAPAPEAPITALTEARSPGFVYVIRAENGLYKIGKSINVDHRVLKIGLIVPFEIELVHSIRCDDMHSAEKMAHVLFASRRVKGEWFGLRQADVDWLSSLTEWG